MLKSNKVPDKKYKCVEDFPLGTYVENKKIQKSVSNRELQRLTGATEYTMTKFLQNKIDISAKKFLMLCDILDIDATELSNVLIYNTKDIVKGENTNTDQQINDIIKRMSDKEKNEIVKTILKIKLEHK